MGCVTRIQPALVRSQCRFSLSVVFRPPPQVNLQFVPWNAVSCAAKIDFYTKLAALVLVPPCLLVRQPPAHASHVASVLILLHTRAFLRMRRLQPCPVSMDRLPDPCSLAVSLFCRAAAAVRVRDAAAGTARPLRLSRLVRSFSNSMTALCPCRPALCPWRCPVPLFIVFCRAQTIGETTSAASGGARTSPAWPCSRYSRVMLGRLTFASCIMLARNCLLLAG